MACGREWRDERATASLKEWILEMLGCDVVGVELTDKELESAILRAQEYWMMWVGIRKSVDLTLTTAREYPAESIASDIDSVVDVYFDVQDTALKDLFGWADVYVNPYQYAYETPGGYSALVQNMQYRDDARKIVSGDRDWGWDETRRVLVISPKISQSRSVRVEYTSRCFDYEYLRTYEWGLFRDYALMTAMKTLAMIRMKYSELPSATGTFTMNGDAMWANAEAMEMRIEDKMRSLVRPLGILTD